MRTYTQKELVGIIGGITNAINGLLVGGYVYWPGGSEAPPEISAEGGANGCALTIRIGDDTFTALSASPDRTVAFNGIETDAEFALTCTRGEEVTAYLLSAGAHLKAQGRSLVEGDTPVDFVRNCKDTDG